MVSFKINGNKLSLPNQLNELTYSKFLQLIKCETDLQKLELLSGQQLKDLPSDCEQAMVNVIAIIDQFEDSIAEYLTGRRTPGETYAVTVFDKPVLFTKHLGQLAYWPFTKVKALIKKMGPEPFNEYEQYLDLVGHYLFAKLQDYDEYKAEAFCEEYVANMPFTDVIALGDFFLFIQHRLWMPKGDYLRAKFQMMKRKLILKFSLSTEK